MPVFPKKSPGQYHRCAQCSVLMYIHRIHESDDGTRLTCVNLQEEVKKRRDFRGECVFSVDPETARVSTCSYVRMCIRTCFYCVELTV